LFNGPSTTLVAGSRWPEHSDPCLVSIYRADSALLHNYSYINALLTFLVKYLTQNYSINVSIFLVTYASILLKFI
jgi:hypothetical protein